RPGGERRRPRRGAHLGSQGPYRDPLGRVAEPGRSTGRADQHGQRSVPTRRRPRPRPRGRTPGRPTVSGVADPDVVDPTQLSPSGGGARGARGRDPLLAPGRLTGSGRRSPALWCTLSVRTYGTRTA